MAGAKECGLKRSRVSQIQPLMILSKEKSNNPLLPEDIIMDEILTRLPVKSLLIFRCVCKSWLLLISSSPRFIKSHLIKSSNSKNYFNHRAIISSLDFTKNISHCTYSLNSILYNGTSPMNAIEPISIPTGPPVNYLNSLSIGSCNGLLCVSPSRDRYTIFNPALKKFHNLPLPGSLSKHTYTHGFGYDHVNDDYKVVRLIGGGAEKYTEFKIYSLKNNCWRNINNQPVEPFNGSKCGVLVSGKLHWVTYSVFVSLDMVTEEFGKVARPKHGYGNDEYIQWLLLESRGCLYSFARGENKMDVWEMKEYGVDEESWTKLGSIQVALTPTVTWFPYPFFVTENGVVLLQTNDSVVLFSLKLSNIVGRKLYDAGKHSYFYFQGYIESLVPPYIDGGEDYTIFADLC